jgi:hypothetical protein
MLFYTKSTYVLKLLLSVVTVGIETLGCVQKSVACELSRVLYFETLKKLLKAIQKAVP